MSINVGDAVWVKVGFGRSRKGVVISIGKVGLRRVVVQTEDGVRHAVSMGLVSLTEER